MIHWSEEELQFEKIIDEVLCRAQVLFLSNKSKSESKISICLFTELQHCSGIELKNSNSLSYIYTTISYGEFCSLAEPNNKPIIELHGETIILYYTMKISLQTKINIY